MKRELRSPVGGSWLDSEMLPVATGPVATKAPQMPPFDIAFFLSIYQIALDRQSHDVKMPSYLMSRAEG